MIAFNALIHFFTKHNNVLLKYPFETSISFMTFITSCTIHRRLFFLTKDTMFRFMLV